MRIVPGSLWILCIVFHGCANSPADQSDRKPNIVFVLADDMGYGDVGCYNPRSRIPTPNMDRLAAQGVRLTDAHSPSSVCTPTRYGILTGRYCWRTWLQRNVVGGYTPPLIEPDRPTVASVLRANGYTTACVGKWHLGLAWTRRNGFVATHADAQKHFRGSWQDGDRKLGMDVDFSRPVHGGPTALGFDYAYFTAACATIDGPFCYIENDRTVGIPDQPIEVDRTKGADFRPRRGLVAPGFRLEMVDVEFTRRAIAFMEDAKGEAPDRPFFLYLALSSPHAPWLPPEFVKGKTKEGPRGELVAVVDWSVGEIVKALGRLGIAGDTLLIVTSDNGPRHGKNGHAAAGELRGHKSHIWEGGHRVPFVARWPGRIAKGTTCDEPIELTDLMATCAGLIGAKLPAGAGPDSYDVSPALFGVKADGPIREAVVSHSCFGVFAIRQGPWKLIVGTESSGGWVKPRGSGPERNAAGQLYNLADDPGEKNNVFGARPDVVRELSDLLDAYKRGDRSAPVRSDHP